MKDSAYTFSRAPQAYVPRSVFNMGHQIKTTLGTDYLYPIYVEEVLPADTFEFSHSLFGRMTTPLTPVMDDMYLDTFFFYVPYRLLDKNFKKLMGEAPTKGLPSNTTVAPMLTGKVDFNSLYDYLGIPPNVDNLSFCPYAARAYTYIYNDWFRDANLIDPYAVYGSYEYGDDLDVADERITSYTLRKRGKRLDYFTGCLPWPQRGPNTYLPLGVRAPVVSLNNATADSYMNGDVVDGKNVGGLYFTNRLDGSIYTSGNIGTGLGIKSGEQRLIAGDVGFNVGSQEDNPPVVPRNLWADLTDATAVTVNQLREAVAVQHLYEAFARGGSRYTEIIRSTFDVVSPDARLQRSEYLGGSSTRLNVTTVAQTSATVDGSTPLGNLAAFVTVNANASWKKSFTEHGIIIGLANIRADLSYSQGLHRKFSRSTRLDFYWPQLANLGEQPVLNKEIYAQGTSVDNDVFGYQERWAELRYHPNVITGTFRPTHPQSLDVWHLSQEFESLPLLNKSFIEEAVPIERVVAVTDEPPFMLWGDFKVKAARPLPLYSVPGLERL